MIARVLEVERGGGGIDNAGAVQEFIRWFRTAEEDRQVREVVGRQLEEMVGSNDSETRKSSTASEEQAEKKEAGTARAYD